MYLDTSRHLSFSLFAVAVVAAIDAIAGENPTPSPTSGLGTAEGAETCMLHGRWYNYFTTAADATFSPDSKRGDASVSNLVRGALARERGRARGAAGAARPRISDTDSARALVCRVCSQVDATSGRTTNIIEFIARDHPAFRATRQKPIPPPVDSLRVILSAAAASATRVELIFRRVRARLNLKLWRWRFQLTLVLPVPGPFITRIVFFFRRKKQPPPAYFDLLYLDETLRVHRTGQGNLFVQQRTPKAPAA